MAKYDVTKRNATSNLKGQSVSLFSIIKNYYSLIRKRKSRNENDYCCPCKNEKDTRRCSSCSTKTKISKSLNKSTSNSSMTFSRLCYSSRVTLLLCLLVQLLYIAPVTECIAIKHHKSSSISRSNSRKNQLMNHRGRSVTNHNAHDIINNVTNTLETSHHHHRHHLNGKSHFKNHDVQAIQPKICHSLTSSNTYLLSAFAHNFASQRSNVLSTENKLVLSPIVFQGMFYH